MENPDFLKNGLRSGQQIPEEKILVHLKHQLAIVRKVGRRHLLLDLKWHQKSSGPDLAPHMLLIIILKGTCGGPESAFPEKWIVFRTAKSGEKKILVHLKHLLVVVRKVGRSHLLPGLKWWQVFRTSLSTLHASVY